MAGSDSAALVVALSAQLTKFEKDMKAAGIMADDAVGKIEKKFSSMSPKISTSFFGNLFANFAGQALSGAVDGLKTLIDRFEELQTTAQYAEVSLQWLYGLQSAGAKAGASFGEINAAVKSLGFQLDEMKRGGDNALKTLLDANPQFLKGVSRDAMTVEQTLRVVADIIAGAKNNIQAFDMAKHLGIPEGSVALLQQGGAAVEKLASEAARAAPDLARMAEQSRALKKVWEDFLQSLQTSVTDRFFSGFKSAVAGIIAMLEHLTTSQQGTLVGGWSAQALEAWKKVGAEIDSVDKKGQRVVITKKGTSTDPFARQAGAAETATALERQTDQIEKHIALMDADTAAVGKNVGEQERLRTEALLTTAAERDGVTATGEYAEALKLLAQRAGEARLAQAQAAEQIAKMNQASQIVGSALSSAFADAIVEGKKLNEVLDSLIKTLLKAAINATVMNLFTPGAGGGLSPFAGLFKAAEGTNSAPGGMALVGEQGPELVNLPRGSQVIPNNILRQGGMGGVTAPIVFNVDNRGASVEAVARMGQVMAEMQATLPAKIVGTIQQARRGRVPGV